MSLERSLELVSAVPMGGVVRGLRRPLSEGWAIIAPLVAAGLLFRRHRLISGAALGSAALVGAALRDPERPCPAGPAAYSPADGRVMSVGYGREPELDVDMLEISIFLALWDVHVQRAPLAGRVTKVRTDPGGFRPAMFGSATENFRQSIYFDTEAGPCVVTQISGLVARRIVRWVQPGDSVAAGNRIGMIKFGSRVTLKLPVGWQPLVSPGMAVRAGITSIALPPETASSL